MSAQVTIAGTRHGGGRHIQRHDVVRHGLWVGTITERVRRPDAKPRLSQTTDEIKMEILLFHGFQHTLDMCSKRQGIKIKLIKITHPWMTKSIND